jgi:hypothetical protein
VRDDVRAFVDLCSRLFAAAGPVVEIGALQTPGQEGYADLRPFFAGRPYFGCDLARGAGVDCVQDAEALGIADGAAATVIAADSLEHVADPFRATGEIHRVLAPGGTAIVAVPFLFPIHYAPDYWRFTPEGVRRLLAPFPVAAVWSLGDAQWPHTVFAVAHKAIDDAGAARFAAAAAQLPARWDATPVRDVLLPFVPVTSLLRRDDGAAQPVPLGPAGVEQELVCPGDRLARIDVRIETPADGRNRVVTVEVADAEALGPPLARAATRACGFGDRRWLALQFPAVGEVTGRRLRLRFACTPPGIALLRAPDGSLCFEAFRLRVPTAGGPPAAARPPRNPSDGSPRG